ncbi:UNVERIFIED_CONTAM: hypothetical protein Sangu_3236300 [Sesamum angustifolium]|uniref:DUF4283 domain-containing protein n=1 Tax=Sesamum angustifolium TaxID=2727405 RepID=A0AAW2JGC1_9LAMI
MEEVIEGGPWLYQGQPIVLQRWEPGMSLRKQKHTQIPVWIRLKHLPMEYWTTEGLSVIASGRCKECQSLGHTATSCPGKKKLTFTKPVEVYVQKARSTAEVVLENEVEHVQQLEVGQSITVATREQGISVELNKQELRPKGESSKGKDIVLYNQFDILHNDILGDAEDPLNTAVM